MTGPNLKDVAEQQHDPFRPPSKPRVEENVVVVAFRYPHMLTAWQINAFR
jgi:hypothetical protein